MKKHWMAVLSSAVLVTGAVTVVSATAPNVGVWAVSEQSVGTNREEVVIRQLTQQWFDLWSPGDQPMDWDAMGELFAQDPGQLLVFDDAGGQILVIESWKDYRETWTPFMEKLTGWQVRPEDEIRVVVDGNLASTTFVLVGGGLDQEGQSVDFRQYGTHVWQKIGDRWVIVHEHLTTDT